MASVSAAWLPPPLTPLDGGERVEDVALPSPGSEDICALAAPAALDPRLFIPRDLVADAGESVSIPIRMHVTEATGITLSGFDVAIAFDPAKLTLGTAQIGSLLAGRGFTGLLTNPAAGRLIYTASSSQGTSLLTLDTVGDLFTVTFQVPTAAAAGPTIVNLLGSYEQLETAAFDNDLNNLLLSPVPTNSDTDSVDGLLTIANSANGPPTVVLQNAVTVLPEDASTTPRIKVADIIVTDDGSGTNVLELSGADAGLFEIDGNVLYLRAGSVLDHETQPELDVAVSVDDATVGETPDDIAVLTLGITNVPPAVTVDQADEQDDPSSDWPVLFTAVFREPVVGFDASDVVLGGTAGASQVAVTELPDGRSYRLAVTGMTQSGTVTAQIPADAAADGAGAGSTASVSTDNIVQYVAPSFHNLANAHDVDGSGRVSPLDVLLLINYINFHPGDPSLPKPPTQPPPYYDVNDDGLCNARDVSAVINYINSHPPANAAGEGEAPLQPAAPRGEPTAGPLAANQATAWDAQDWVTRDQLNAAVDAAIGEFADELDALWR